MTTRVFILLTALLTAIFAVTFAPAFAATIPVTLTAVPSSAVTNAEPVLTWTAPGAASCKASGNGWSGAKAPSGTEQMASIAFSKTYTLICVSGAGDATIEWTPPTQNTDGTTLTDLQGYEVVHGTSPTTLNDVQTVPGGSGAAKYVWTDLPAGAHFFAVRAKASSGLSANSNIGSKSIASGSSGTATATVIISATPPATTKPKAPTITSVTQPK